MDRSAAPPVESASFKNSHTAMKCRILYLVGQLGSGGLERQLYYLLSKIDRQRYRPGVAIWNFSEQDTYVSQIRALGVPVYGFETHSNSILKFVAFRRLLRKLAPEIVHSYSFFTNCAASWGAFGTRAIAIGSVRSGFAWAQLESGLLRGKVNARWPRSQIFNSFAAAEQVQGDRTLFVPNKVFVVRNGIDLNSFQIGPANTPTRPLILGVGSLFEVKRWDRLLRAASALQRRNLDFAMQLVGEGPLRSNLENLALQLNLNGRLELSGHVNDVAAIVRRATIVVHTSDSEGCPNVVMEAMACGRPVVATAVGDVPSLIEDGKTGFVVRCGDDRALIERIATLIADRDLCWRMGKAGRAKAEREFGLDCLVENTFSAYRAAGWNDASL